MTATWLLESERDQLRDAPGSALAPVRVDVTDPASIEKGIGEGRGRFGPVEGLVHLVGAWAGGSDVHAHDVAGWDKMIAVNLTSAFLCCRQVLPDMIEANKGRIVLVSSRTARQDRSGQVGYAVAKAGVEVLAETIAEENRAYNVTANIVAPSTMDTSGNRAAMPDADTSVWVSPEDVASAISHLIEEPSGAIRGATIPLNGGV